jgi:diguanylate cyclase (GGDEF)-like protein
VGSSGDEQPEVSMDGEHTPGVPETAVPPEPLAFSGSLPPRPAGRYVVGLTMLALVSIIATFLVSYALGHQRRDASELSAAAGQILLSRRVADTARQLASASGGEADTAAADLAHALDQLIADQIPFQPDDGVVDTAGGDLEGLRDAVLPDYERLVGLGEVMVAAHDAGEPIDPGDAVAVETASNRYAAGMGAIVSRLGGDAESRVAMLRNFVFGFLVLTIMLLIAEGLFLFRPAARAMRREWRIRDREYEAAREEDRRRMNYVARFDPLTGLINRVLFGDRLHNAIIRSQRDGGLVALMFVDLDQFKAINDRFGHSIGDELLQQVARRLVSSVRATDSVARIGGDEFTVILEGGQRVEDAGQVATKILRTLEEPYRVRDRELQVTASIGIALYPIDGDDADALLRDADIAMYSAKAAGMNTYQYFTPELRQRTSERLHLIDGLRRALEVDDGLMLVYQPWVDVGTGTVLGVEALARWDHPEHGLVLPERFVSVAEETDLILPLGEWALFEGCRQLAEWHRAGIDDLAVSLNISTRQLQRGNLVEIVEQALAGSGIDGSRLCLEFKEETLLTDSTLARRTLERLRERGVRVVIDNFGSGYSSFRELKDLPLDILKIDRSFVDEATTRPATASLSAAIIELGHSLGVDVIAEGVESREQVDLFAQLGCEQFQGFYFSRPMPPMRLQPLLAHGVKIVDVATPKPRPPVG